jgi:hypothetical protein
MDSSRRRRYSVSTAKGRPKNRGSIRGRGEKLSKKHPQRLRLPTHGLFTGYHGLFAQELKRPECEADPAYSSYEAKNQCTCTSTPPSAVKCTFTDKIISRDALRLPIVISFLKDSSPFRLVSDCTSKQYRIFSFGPNDSSTVAIRPARLHLYL